MAYGDFTAFAPSKSQYRHPGEFEQVAKAEAVKKATYLSSMDQFYAQLGESARQFDAGQEFKEEQLEETKYQFRESLGFQEEELSERGRQFDVSTGLSETQMEQQESQYARSLKEESRQFGDTMGLEQEKLTSQESQFTRSLGLEEEKFESQEDFEQQRIDLAEDAEAFSQGMSKKEYKLTKTIAETQEQLEKDKLLEATAVREGQESMFTKELLQRKDEFTDELDLKTQEWTAFNTRDLTRLDLASKELGLEAAKLESMAAIDWEKLRLSAEGMDLMETSEARDEIWKGLTLALESAKLINVWGD